jgi:uncharacterized metal-binding protein YceD (DUF177 family)
MSEPFSRPIRVEAIPRDGLETRVEADDAERAELAAFNNLPAVGKLVAAFTLKPGARGTVIVRGELSAEITQTCVVTLEPFEATIEEAIDLRFAPAVEAPKPRGGAGAEAETSTVGDEDEPDPIVDGKIDLGAIASEFLTLSLDPYPRKPGVAFESPEGDEDGPDNSPFSVLGKSKKPT